MEMTIKIASLITSSLSFIGVIFIIYNHFRKPDEDASKNNYSLRNLRKDINTVNLD